MRNFVLSLMWDCYHDDKKAIGLAWIGTGTAWLSHSDPVAILVGIPASILTVLKIVHFVIHWKDRNKD
jgi:hypothetical protein